VSSVVVHDDVYVLTTVVDGGCQAIKKTEELLMSVPGLAVSKDRSV